LADLASESTLPTVAAASGRADGQNELHVASIVVAAIASDDKMIARASNNSYVTKLEVGKNARNLMDEVSVYSTITMSPPANWISTTTRRSPTFRCVLLPVVSDRVTADGEKFSLEGYRAGTGNGRRIPQAQWIYRAGIGATISAALRLPIVTSRRARNPLSGQNVTAAKSHGTRHRPLRKIVGKNLPRHDHRQRSRVAPPRRAC
jgi:hypothetical protein